MAACRECLVVGGCTVDFFVRPLAGEVQDKCYLHLVQRCPGGGGRNAALALVKMGLDVTILASVGSDAFADGIIEELQNASIRTHFLQRVPTITGFSLVDLASGKLTSLRGANEFLRVPAELDLSLSEFEYVYLASIPCEFQREFCEVFTGQIPLFLNPGAHQIVQGKKDLTELIGKAWVVQLNLKEARLLFRTDEAPWDLAKQLVDLGAQCGVVTDGPRGVWAATEDRQVYHQPALPCNLVDPTACGDAFGAGLVAGLAHGLSLQHSLRIAAANAASVAEHLGATGFLSFVQAVERAGLYEFREMVGAF